MIQAPSLEELKIGQHKRGHENLTGTARHSQTFSNNSRTSEGERSSSRGNWKVKLLAEGMIFDIKYSNMLTNRGDRPTNVDKVHLDSGYYAKVPNEDKEQRLAYISEPPGYTIEEDALILQQLEAKNPTETHNPRSRKCRKLHAGCATRQRGRKFGDGHS